MTKTVKVRIAVGVDAEGNWTGYGWRDAPDDARETLNVCLDDINDGEIVYWLTAELPIPTEPPTIEATVETGDG